MRRPFLVLLFLSFLFLGQFARANDPSSAPTAMGASAPSAFPAGFPQSCELRVKVPSFPEKKGEYSRYVGYWPAVNLCQVLVVRAKNPQENLPVIYAYEGSSQHPSGSVPVPNAKYADTSKKLSFTLPWYGRPEVTYDLSSGQATYKDRTGTYPGAIMLTDGEGIVPFLGPRH